MRMAYAMRLRTGWLTPALATVVVAFLAFSLPPYLTGGTRVPATFVLHYPLLIAHVMFGSVAMVTALAQAWPRLRARHRPLHRRVGHGYVAAAIPAAACAMVIGIATPFGPLLAVSNVLLAALWLWFTINGINGINGFVAARQRQFADHRRHMIRSVTLAFSTITNRIWTPILFVTLQPLQDSVFDGDEDHFLWFAAGLGAWLGWTIPFAAVQWWLHKKPVMATWSISHLTDKSPV